MIIDPLKPRYYQAMRVYARANRKAYFYQIWQSLDLPWLVRDSGPYATESDARQAGDGALRDFLDTTTA
jgi:hypothetical protein